MNIAKIMIPKVSTAFLRDTMTVRQGLEVMRHHGYTAVPVLDKDEHYIGSVTEGDFLRKILELGTTDFRELEKYSLKELVREDFCTPLSIDAEENEVMDAILKQNFVPVVDGRNYMCGIVTRRSVIQYMYNKQ